MVSYDDPFHIGLTGRQITTLGTSLVLVTLLVTFVLVVLISRVTRRFDPNSTSSPRLAALLIGLGIGFTYGAQAAPMRTLRASRMRSPHRLMCWRRHASSSVLGGWCPSSSR